MDILELFKPVRDDPVSKVFWGIMLAGFAVSILIILHELISFIRIVLELKKIQKNKSINYQEMEELLTKSTFLSKIFRDFKTTINQDSSKVYYLSSQSDNFLSELDGFSVLVDYCNFNGIIAKYIPSFFTSLGILGTFMGIVIGLGGLKTDNADLLRNSISKLIKGAHLSFRTSLWGITLSIIFLLFYNVILNFMDSKVRDFKQILKYRIGLKTKENYDESQQTTLLEGIKGSQEKLATEIADAFKENVVEQIIPRLAVKFDELYRKFEESDSSMRENFNSLNEQFEKIIINNSKDIRENLSRNFNSLLQQQQDAGKKLQHTLDNQHKTLQESQEQIRDLLIDTGNNQVEAFDILKQVMEDSQKSFINLMEDMAESQKRMFESQEKAIANAQKQTGEIFKESITSKAQDEVVKLQNALKQVTETLQTITNQSISSTEKTNNMMQEMMLNWKDSMKDQQSLNINAQGLTESFSQIVASMNQAVEKLNSATLQIDGKVLQGVSNVNQQVGSITNRLEDFSKHQLYAVGEQRETLELLNDTVNNTIELANKQQTVQNLITSELQQLDQKLASINQRYSGMTENFKHYTDNLLAVNRSYMDLFKNFRESQTQVNETMLENTEDFTEVVESAKELMKTIDRDILTKTSKTTTQLASISSQLDRFIKTYERFSEAEKESQRVWKTYKDNFDKLNIELIKGFENYTDAFNRQVEKTTQEYDSHIGKAVSTFAGIINRLEDLISENSSIMAKPGRR